MKNEFSEERLHMLLALADGELHAEEAARLEASLTDIERSFVHSERALRRNVVAAFDNVEVPSDVWSILQKKLDSRKTILVDRRIQVLRLIRMFAAAAIILIAVGIVFQIMKSNAETDVAKLLIENENASINSYIQQAKVNEDIDKISQFAVSHEITINLSGLEMIRAMPKNGDHSVYLLGATTVRIGNTTCLSLLFNCCENPVQIVIAPKDSDASKALSQMSGLPRKHSLIETRSLEKVTATFIGSHDGRKLLMLLG